MTDPTTRAAEAACCVCGSTDLMALMAIPDVPIHCNLLWDDRDRARGAPRGEIDLALCTACGHVQNVAFDPSLMEYTQAYENSLHFSPRFQRYATALAERLVARYDLHGKTVIEIGSGKGEFLRLLAELGDNHGIGFDPSYVPNPADEATRAGSLTFVRDFYSESYAGYRGDLICCRHVLEHIARPVEFLQAVRRSVDEGHRPGVFFEVPNGLYTLRDLSIWDVIYEHPSYFTPTSLARAFERAGFAVEAVTEAFEEQFLWLDALPRDPDEPPAEDGAAPPPALRRHADAFAGRYRAIVREWRGRLQELHRRGVRVVLWGAGSKGVTFLNALDRENRISYVVDVNPRKGGMYVAGTGQRIVAPEFLREYRPEVVIITNPNYREEIGEQLADLGVSAKVVLA